MQGELWTDAVVHVPIVAPALPIVSDSGAYGSFENLVAHATHTPEQMLPEPLCLLNVLPALVGVGGGASVAFRSPTFANPTHAKHNKKTSNL